ncbi:hypothetical protein [Natronoglomus mannanivorans]|uniref:Uncharacterized protein n=1 Tax=Natronoglomus mannanivorans TaxID=2979990 RepID=A0AAP3E549_9EURY|nr:hypothetical protein [Halobacteria archaeon AArc-xg1-1]
MSPLCYDSVDVDHDSADVGLDIDGSSSELVRDRLEHVDDDQ